MMYGAASWRGQARESMQLMLLLAMKLPPLIEPQSGGVINNSQADKRLLLLDRDFGKLARSQAMRL